MKFLLTSTLIAASLASGSQPSTQAVVSSNFYACQTASGSVTASSIRHGVLPTCPTTMSVTFWNQRGPQGPQGVRGLQGPQGAPGAGVLQWFDADGRYVGTYFDTDKALVVINGNRFVIPILHAPRNWNWDNGGYWGDNSHQTRTAPPRYYTTNNCTGTAYYYLGDAPYDFAATAPSEMEYFADGRAFLIQLDLNSAEYRHAHCWIYEGQTVTDSPVDVVATVAAAVYDLNALHRTPLYLR